MDGPTTTARGGRAAYNAVKHSLFADLRGTVLEIGAGKGANFGLLPGQVRWVGLEPGRRRRRLAQGRPGLVLAGVGERIPLRDHSVDAVVSTIVLCSVRDQDQVLAEVRRVLRPGTRASPAARWRYGRKLATGQAKGPVDHLAEALEVAEPA
jgi:SAM-dependent methyltransferase